MGDLVEVIKQGLCNDWLNRGKEPWEAELEEVGYSHHLIVQSLNDRIACQVEEWCLLLIHLWCAH